MATILFMADRTWGEVVSALLVAQLVLIVLIVLPGADLEHGRLVGERLRQRIELLTSVTVGVVTWQPGEGLDEVRGRADRALYEAKRAGRGRVAVADAVAAR